MNTQPINTPDRARGDRPAELDRGGRAAPTWAGDRERSPDPVMIEKAREALWETFGAWPSGPLAAWLTEQDCERLARAALSAANVPALAAEVERLHDALQASNGEAGSLWDQRDATLARATSAEQERDRLRAGVESVMATLEASHQATALGSIDEPGRSKALAEDDAYRRLRALLAGSGEQPAPTALVRVEWGVVLDDLGSTDVYDTREEAEARADGGEVVRVETWRVGSGEQLGPLKAGVMALTGLSSDEVDAIGGVREEGEQPGERDPAPVVPDECPSCGSGSHWRVDAMCRPAPVVPDSPDDVRAYRGRIRRLDRDQYTPLSVTLDDIADQRARGWPDFHPEDYCHRCGNPNSSWFVDSETWRAVMGDGSRWGGIVCIPCFVELAEQGSPMAWRLTRDESGTIALAVVGQGVTAADERWGVYSYDDGRWYPCAPPTREHAEHSRELMRAEGEACDVYPEHVGQAMQNAAAHARHRAAVRPTGQGGE